jgi:F-type H+-transporting ATPase subunit b
MSAYRYLIAFLTSGAGALVALPALAEEKGAAKAGLPQLDVSLFPEQLFWLAVTFASLYLLMRYVALPGVKATQDKRKGVIGAELEAAKAANGQARAMGAEADKALAEARSKANATISAIKLEASKTASEQQAAQHKQLSQRLQQAEAGIAATRDAALKEIEGVAAGLAEAIVENVSGIKVKA